MVGLDQLYSPSFWVRRVSTDQIISKHMTFIIKVINNCTTMNVEEQYSPHLWVKRFSPNEILLKYIEFIKQGSEDCLKIPNQLNVPYGKGPQEKYDIFGTDLPDDSAIFVYIHGGYWQEKDINRNVSRYVANQMYKNKHKSIIIGYDLCPEVSLHQIIEQIHDALTKCADYAHRIKSKGIFLAGHSAGAHLIAMFFKNFKSLQPEHQNVFKKVFLFGGIYDLTPLIQTSYNNALQLNNKMAKNLSPLHLDLPAVTDVEFYILAAQFDSPAFVEQSKKYYEKLIESGFNVHFKLVERVDHFDLVERLNDADYEITKLLMNLMK